MILIWAEQETKCNVRSFLQKALMKLAIFLGIAIERQAVVHDPSIKSYARTTLKSRLYTDGSINASDVITFYQCYIPSPEKLISYKMMYMTSIVVI